MCNINAVSLRFNTQKCFLNTDSYADVVRTLCLNQSNSFALIISTRRSFTPEAENMLNRRGSLLLTLDEELLFSNKGKLQAVRQVPDVFAIFQVNTPSLTPTKNLLRQEERNGLTFKSVSWKARRFI